MVVYNSGYKDTLETCVRRAVMTGINQMAGQTSINNALEMGAEYVKVSKHSDARVNPNNKIADHKGWQGKVYKLDGEDKKYKNLLKETGFDYKGEESDPLGLCGYNCRHVMSPYFPEDEESDEDSEAEEEKMKKEEEEHERLAEERELTREITTLKRMSEAYEAALDKCMDDEIQKELKNYKKKIEYDLKECLDNQNEKIYNGGIPKDWKIINSEEDDALRNANPNYWKDVAYRNNCANCVVAYEMRKRGYDVVARPTTHNHILSNNPELAWINAEIINTTDSGLKDIIKEMIKWGNHSRAEVAVMWNKQQGHVFVAENIDENIRFIDPQNGTVIKETEFEKAVENMTLFWRIDNLEISDRGRTSCESR